MRWAKCVFIHMQRNNYLERPLSSSKPLLTHAKYIRVHISHDVMRHCQVEIRIYCSSELTRSTNAALSAIFHVHRSFRKFLLPHCGKNK